MDMVLTAREVAQQFGAFFTEDRLRQWRWRGGGPVYRKIGKRCVYQRSDIQAWLDANVRDCTKQPEPGDPSDSGVQ